MSSFRFPLRCTALALALVFLGWSAAAAQYWQGRATMELKVAGARSGPVSGAQVSLTFLEGAPEVVPGQLSSDHKGMVNLSGLAEGRWRVRIDHPDFFSYVTVIVVEIGRKVEVVEAAHEASATGSGLLRARFGKVVAGAVPATRPTVATRPQPAAPQAVAPSRPQTVPGEAVPSGAEVTEEPSPPAQPVDKAAPGGGAEPGPATQPQAPSEAAAVVEPQPEAVPAVEADPSPADAPMPEPEPMPEAEPEPQSEVATPAAVAPTPSRAAEPVAEPVAAPEPTLDPEPTEEPATAPEAAAEVPPAAEEDPVEVVEPAPTAAPKLSPGEPTPEVTPAPTAPAAVTAPEPAAELPTAAVRSWDRGTCHDCRPGESALSIGQAVPAGDGSCPSAVDGLLRQAVEAIGAQGGAALRTFYGPLGSRTLQPATQRFGTELATEVDRLVAPLQEGSCQVLVAVLPAAARFSGYRYEARDFSAGGDCLPDQDCPIGQAQWLGNPGIVRGEGFTLIWATFANRSADRIRHPRLTVYFK